MYYIFGHDTKDDYDRFCFFENAFSKDECEQLILLAEQLPSFDATVGAQDNGGELNQAIRKSQLRWITYGEGSDWIFSRLKTLIKGANCRYGFQLTGFFEGLQYTEYNADSSHYTWHQDHGAKEHSVRKLSCVLQLSDPADYEGGELELFGLGAVQKQQGTLIVFPSYEQHRVTPITKGFRRSLVAWATGPAFQ
jgi:PKHD-type hydroxylase